MTPVPPDRLAGYKLVRDGTLVAFEIVHTNIEDAASGDEALVQIDLRLGEKEDPDDEESRTADHEWGALGFIFCLAVLSFQDARPRGVSEKDYNERDEFTVADLDPPPRPLVPLDASLRFLHAIRPTHPSTLPRTLATYAASQLRAPREERKPRLSIECSARPQRS